MGGSCHPTACPTPWPQSTALWLNTSLMEQNEVNPSHLTEISQALSQFPGAIQTVTCANPKPSADEKHGSGPTSPSDQPIAAVASSFAFISAPVPGAVAEVGRTEEGWRGGMQQFTVPHFCPPVPGPGQSARVRGLVRQLHRAAQEKPPLPSLPPRE